MAYLSRRNFGVVASTLSLGSGIHDTPVGFLFALPVWFQRLVGNVERQEGFAIYKFRRCRSRRVRDGIPSSPAGIPAACKSPRPIPPTQMAAPACFCCPQHELVPCRRRLRKRRAERAEARTFARFNLSFNPR